MTNSEKLTSGVVMNIPQGIDRRVAKNGEVSYRVRIRINEKYFLEVLPHKPKDAKNVI